MRRPTHSATRAVIPGNVAIGEDRIGARAQPGSIVTGLVTRQEVIADSFVNKGLFGRSVRLEKGKFRLRHSPQGYPTNAGNWPQHGQDVGDHRVSAACEFARG
jgi:hypothetical protein